MKLKKNLCALVLGVTCLSSAYVAFAADGVSVTGDARKDTYVNISTRLKFRGCRNRRMNWLRFVLIRH